MDNCCVLSGLQCNGDKNWKQFVSVTIFNVNNWQDLVCDQFEMLVIDSLHLKSHQHNNSATTILNLLAS